MSARISEQQLIPEAPPTFAALLDIPKDRLEVQERVQDEKGELADLMVSAAGKKFLIEVVGSPTVGRVAARAEHVAKAAKRLRHAVPVIAVPFMSEAGRQACMAAGVSWFDYSGNAHIVAPGIRIIIDGQPNRFRGPGRPASIFAPKSARVARWLLMHPHRAFTQREIARATDMAEGFVSRIASRLEHDSYVVRETGGALRVRNPQLLLEAWREEYQFEKHTLVQGHVAARSGDALAWFVSDTLAASGIEHAATGLAAAWQMTHFASFRIATFFLAVEPSKELIEKLRFREESRGANLWLVVPNDAGVFHGAEPQEGICCVHPVQAYLDLKGHPERAAEAADRLRTELLNWRRHV